MSVAGHKQRLAGALLEVDRLLGFLGLLADLPTSRLQSLAIGATPSTATRT